MFLYDRSLRRVVWRVETSYLREFVELAQRLNFTAAAKSLHITQPALSNHVAALERQVGALLIERSPAGENRLTREGGLFLEYAVDALDRYGAMLERIHAARDSVAGAFVIRSPRNEYSDPMLGYVMKFKHEHPSVQVTLLPWTDADGFDDVASGVVDVAYAASVSCDPIEREDIRVQTVELANYAVYVWADAKNPIARGEAVLPRDLEGQVIAIPATQKRATWAASISTILRQNGVSASVRERYCDSLEDLVLNKVGADEIMLFDEKIARLPAFALRPDRVMRLLETDVPNTVYLAYRASDANPGLVEFVRFIRDAAGLS